MAEIIIIFVAGAFTGFIFGIAYWDFRKTSLIRSLEDTISKQGDREVKLSLRLKEQFHYLRAFEKALQIIGSELHEKDNEETFVIKKRGNHEENSSN